MSPALRDGGGVLAPGIALLPAPPPPGLVGVGKERHPTQPVSHPFFLQTSGTVVLSPSWSTSMEALTWKGQAT